LEDVAARDSTLIAVCPTMRSSMISGGTGNAAFVLRLRIETRERIRASVTLAMNFFCMLEKFAMPTKLARDENESAQNQLVPEG